MLASVWSLDVFVLQLYVPDEDKSIFGRSVNKQVFEGFTTGLLQTTATVLGCLSPLTSESGKTENTLISSPDPKVKNSATESFNTRTHDLIRYFPSSYLFSSAFLWLYILLTGCKTWSTSGSSIACLVTYLLTKREPSWGEKNQMVSCQNRSIVRMSVYSGIFTIYTLCTHWVTHFK